MASRSLGLWPFSASSRGSRVPIGSSKRLIFHETAVFERDIAILDYLALARASPLVDHRHESGLHLIGFLAHSIYRSENAAGLPSRQDRSSVAPACLGSVGVLGKRRDAIPNGGVERSAQRTEISPALGFSGTLDSRPDPRHYHAG